MAEQISKIDLIVNGGDYETLTAWQAGEGKNLVGTGNKDVAEMYISTEEEVDLTAWTTDADEYWIVRPATGYEHDGTPGSGIKVSKASTGTIVISVSDLYNRIIGIEIENTSASNYKRAILLKYGAIAQDCIIKGGQSATGSHGVISGDHSSVINCLLYESGTSGIFVDINKADVTIKHCTLVSNGVYGITYAQTGLDGDVLIQGCVAYNNGTADYYGNANSPNASSDYNVSGDDTQYGTNSFDIDSDPFLNSADDDYRIGSGSALQDACVLDTDVDDDCIGTARPQGDYRDIGWFEYVAGATGWTGKICGVTNPTKICGEDAAVKVCGDS